MLSKNNKILIGCLTLLLVMSVGYALFSDTITINGTATAKGEFDITATCQTGISSELGTVESLGLAAEGGYENDTCSAVDDTVSFSTNFLYPGARKYFTVKMTNTGTIDAIIYGTDTKESQEICISDNELGENRRCAQSFKLEDYKVGYGMYFVAMEDPNGNLLSESEMNQFINNENGTFTLKSDYSIYARVATTFNHVNANASYEGEKFFVEHNFSVELLYKQAQ